MFRGSLHRMLRLIGVGAICAIAALAACVGGQAVPSAVPSQPAASVPPAAPQAAPQAAPLPDHIYRETGTASWYGKEFHGNKTASGEVFDMNGFSAAHRTLPLGTVIRVTNLDNFKSITVTINDRGPSDKSRSLDLSYGAAKELDFVAQGIARVKIETLKAVHDRARYTVQAATFAEKENALMLRDWLAKKFERVFIVPFETNIARFYHVRVGSYGSKKRAEQVAAKLMLEGLEPVVLRKD